MMKVNLKGLHCLAEPEVLEKLNAHIKIQTTLMAHQIAITTGCTITQGFELVLLLWNQSAADLFLLIYHVKHPDAPIGSTPFLSGFPKTPLFCEECNTEIESSEDLNYEILAKIKEEIEFVKE